MAERRRGGKLQIGGICSSMACMACDPLEGKRGLDYWEVRVKVLFYRIYTPFLLGNEMFRAGKTTDWESMQHQKFRIARVESEYNQSINTKFQDVGQTFGPSEFRETRRQDSGSALRGGACAKCRASPSLKGPQT